ncbi:MAG TPA: hypothetical protein VJ436_04145 [Anaerolineales bacterium]|nr:hypothetical protein [Anaerolineales bacterium]
MPFLTIETLPGETIQAGTKKITPYSQAVKLILPGARGGLVWNRPSSVLVQGDDGSQQVLPVVDLTRIAQLILLGIGLAGGLFLWLIKGQSSARAYHKE